MEKWLSFTVKAFFIFACVVALARSAAATATNERHVVLVVWDGMRPDFISERNTPRLWALAREGVRFTRHHSVYPTSTEVNGTALATGVYPTRSGLLANREYRPAINPSAPIDTGELENIRRGDEVSQRQYLAVPTVAEISRAAGLSTAIAGSKAVVFLHDRHAEWTTAVTPKTALTIFAATPMPPHPEQSLGPFLIGPDDTNASRNLYVTRALTDLIWREQVPAFSVLWLSEPDLAQHATAPGSAAALAAIKTADDCLGSVIDSLKTKQQFEQTDVFVVSDHGFSTVERTVDLPAQLRAAGFTAANQFTVPPKPGDILTVGNGGTVLFYVAEHEPKITARLVEWLQHSDFAGVLFTREKFEGTFPLEQANLATKSAPDVVMSFRWTAEKNAAGVPGMILADAGRKIGTGSHASLSASDIHNTFVAAGPDFRRGMLDELATANVDLAPTILRLLHLLPPASLDGRILDEALNLTDTRAEPAISAETLTATRNFADGEWRQTLQRSRVGRSDYLDEGNGAFRAK